MILSVGISIIDVNWIQNRFQHQPEIFKTIFHPEEIAYCDSYRFSGPHYAGRYAAKQAVRKALGLLLNEEAILQEIHIHRTSTGQPIVQLSGQTLDWVQTLNKETVFFLSISHSRSHAVALAVTEKRESDSFF